MKAKILVVDDEEDIRTSLRGILEDEGHEVREAGSGEAALEYAEKDLPDLVFLDVWLPGIDGLEVLDRLRPRYPETQVVVISGHGSVETAVSAVKKGAFDFIEKPFSLEKVIVAADKALEFSRLQRENLALKNRIESEQNRNLTGKSRAVEELKSLIARVAPTDAWVLITGENGTGKEIVARAIHHLSRRRSKPMIDVNCAAIPEELIESELFGHEKGAFTGADKPRTGKFELADNGTLFLDEIGDMSLKTQAKILRILQERRFERVGGAKTIDVDVRVIAATNKNLPDEIKAGRFREDLYYRLKVFPLEIPPLRERKEDIPMIIEEFLNQFVERQGLKRLEFSDGALDAVVNYSWPGNVRELKNFIERMLISYPGKKITPAMLPAEFRTPVHDAPDAEDIPDFDVPESDFKKARARFETVFLEKKLGECQGNVTKLAESIGLERSYLYRKLKTLGIHVSESAGAQ